MNDSRWPHLAKKTRQKSVFFAAIGKIEWCLILTEKFAWMRIKGNNRRQQAIAPSRSGRSRNNRLMAAMATVKITNCRRQPRARKSRTGQWRIANGPINHLDHVYLLVFHSAELYRLTPLNINL
jgi:hypothetical protein